MADVLLYHSVLGLRPVELGLADAWRDAGHRVRTPGLFDGRTAGTYDDGFALLKDIGLPTVTERALAAAAQAPEGIVLAGISMGAGMVSRAWQERPDASGILFLAGPAPWPDNVTGTPVQLHAARPEPFDDEAVFDDWIAANPGARVEVFRYDDVGHFFLDPSLPDYSETASQTCRARCLDFLATLSAPKK